jgi:hypothetical protein
MNTCCDYGKCTNSPDCPGRKQRTKEVNEAYVKGFLMGQEDPLDDLADTFKALLVMVTVVLCGWVLYLLIWGK